MDPITQGALGAATAQIVLGRRFREALSPPKRSVWLYGALGGMAADLDVLIRSSSDPLISVEYHRHFTHSLAFIPIGGVLAALPFVWQRRGGRWKLQPAVGLIVAAFVVGYATHALLDWFTAYGTMLGWPFTEERFAVDWIAVVDFGFTLPLLVGVVWAHRKRRTRPAAVGLSLALAYLLFGGWQHARAREAHLDALAARELPAPERARQMPTLFNLVRWRAVADDGERLHVMALRVPLFGGDPAVTGESGPVDKLTPAEVAPEHREDVARWSAFADGWLVRTEEGYVGDARYSRDPASFDPLWALELLEGGEVRRVDLTPPPSDLLEIVSGSDDGG